MSKNLALPQGLKNKPYLEDDINSVNDEIDKLIVKRRDMKRVNKAFESVMHYFNTAKDQELFNKTVAKFIQYNLTPQETLILFMVIRHMSTADICEKMGKSVRAIKFHKTGIYRKLEVSSERELFKIYYGEYE